MVLIGGVLLVTPGVLTDITGFILIAPPTRTMLAPLFKKAVMKRFNVTGATQTVYGEPGPPSEAPTSPPKSPQMGHFDHPEL